MRYIVKEHKRLSTSETIFLVEDSKENEKLWRHRYCVKDRNTSRHQLTVDYELNKFRNLVEFQKYVETLPKPVGHLI